MLYQWKVRSLKIPRFNLMWRQWRARRGEAVGNYNDLPRHIRKHAPGKSFADIGCMWGVNGEYAFLAEEAGATRVVRRGRLRPDAGVRGEAPDSKLERRVRPRRHLACETLARIGQVDVVFCAGVLYHHPSPFDLLVALAPHLPRRR